MPLIDFDAVKALVGMQDVLRLLGWTPNFREPTGDRGRCPLHGGGDQHSRSFAVCRDGFFCWKCRRFGDQLRLYAEVTRQDIFRATRRLCYELSVEVPYLAQRDSGSKRNTPPAPIQPCRPFRAEEHYHRRRK